MEALNNAWNEASSKMYESVRGQQAAGGQQGPFAGSPPPSGQAGGESRGGNGGKKVENADYEVVDDK